MFDRYLEDKKAPEKLFGLKNLSEILKNVIFTFTSLKHALTV